MISKNTNKNEVKLLATIMVFVMAFAGVVLISSDTSYADDTEVSPSTNEASVGDKEYETLAAAIDAVKEGSADGTITLLKDVEIKQISGDVSINGDHKMITFTGEVYCDDIYGKVTMRNVTIDSKAGLVGIHDGPVTFEGVTVESEFIAYTSFNILNGCSFHKLLQFQISDDYAYDVKNSTINELCIYPCKTEGHEVTVSNEKSSIVINQKTIIDIMSLVANNVKLENCKLDVGEIKQFEWTEKDNETGKMTDYTGEGKLEIGKGVEFTPTSGTTVVDVGVEVCISENSVLSVAKMVLEGKLVMKEGSILKGIIQNVTGGVTNSITSQGGIKAGEGGIVFSKGSIVMNGSILSADNNGIIKITGRATLDANTSVENLLIEPGAELAIPANMNLTLTGESVNNGTITNNGTVKNQGVMTNNGNIVNNDEAGFTNVGEEAKIVQTSEGTIDGEVTGTIVSDTSESKDSLGLKNYLDNDLPISNKAFLADNLTIREGVTLTIGSTGTLDLNGYMLILEGNLVVANGGSITALNTADASHNAIQITKTGSISNDGVIGKGANAVMITTETADAGEVSIKNVNGASFGTKKNVTGDTVTYTLTVSGTILKEGIGDASIKIDGAIITSDMSIGNDVEFIGTDAKVAKNTTLTVNGTAGGSVFINAGATVQLNGNTDVAGLTVAGYAQTVGAGQAPSKALQVNVKNTNGLTISAISETFMKGTDQMTRYTVHMSGTPALSEESKEAQITANMDSVEEQDRFVYVDGELLFNKSFIEEVTDNKITIPLKVSGKVTYSAQNFITDYYGTSYSIQTDATGNYTYYITSFDAAFGVIDTTVGKTITVNGNIELSLAYELKAKQVIKINGETTVTVKSSGSMIIAKEAVVNGTIEKVEGVVTVLYGGKATVGSYDVKTVATNGDVTYSGILIAIENAQPGQTVTIVQDAQIEDASLTIPEGVKVVITDSATLTVDKDLIIKGELVNNGSVSVGKDLNVSGKADATLTGLSVGGKITSSGELLLPMGDITTYVGMINSAVYKNDDGYNVVTTISKAVSASAAMDIPQPVDVYGEVSEDSVVNAKNVKINVKQDAKVTITEIILEKASLIIVGEFTGKVTGQSGTEGTTVTSTVALTEVSLFNVTNGSIIESDGSTLWTTSIETTAADEVLRGKISIDTGSIALTSDLNVNSGATDSTKSELSIAADAALAVKTDITLTSTKDTSVNGTLQIEGTFKADDAKVAGNLIVKKKGTVEARGLTVTGVASVESDESNPGKLEVTKLILGNAPKSLGDGASVTGPITMTSSGYIIAYPGAQISASDIDEGTAVSTELIVNGYTYCTLFAKKDSNVGIFGDAGIFIFDFKLSGLDMTGSNNSSNWKSNESMTSSIANVVGEDAKIYFSAEPALVSGKISVGTGLALYIDGLSTDNVKDTADGKYKLTVGTHTVTYSVLAGYDGTNAKITFNGQTVGSDGKITVTAEMAEFVLTINGATPASTVTPVPAPITPASDDDMGLTEYLLIILVILAAILVIVVAIRMMRS